MNKHEAVDQRKFARGDGFVQNGATLTPRARSSDPRSRRRIGILFLGGGYLRRERGAKSMTRTWRRTRTMIAPAFFIFFFSSPLKEKASLCFSGLSKFSIDVIAAEKLKVQSALISDRESVAQTFFFNKNEKRWKFSYVFAEVAIVIKFFRVKKCRR